MSPRRAAVFLAFAVASVASARPTTHTVMVSGLTFSPATVNAQSGDTVAWVGLGGIHTVTQTIAPGSCTSQTMPAFGSPPGASMYSWVIPGTFSGTVTYKCTPHCGAAMRGTIIVTAPPPPPCQGDATGDRVVEFGDITSVLANWGGTGPAGDADHDNDVDFGDVTAVLANFGVPCP
jgi:plastocyanin